MKVVKKFEVNFDVKQFQQSVGTCKIVVRVLQFFMSSLLYIEVWKRSFWLPTRQKESFEAWSNHQWSVAWFGYCPMKEQFQIHSTYGGITSVVTAVVLVLLHT